MKIEKKKIYFFLILTLSISLSVFSWNSINLPSTNSEIIGNYYLNGVSSFNDVVRYVVFMAIPVIFYLSWKFIFEKNKPNDLLSNIKLIKENIETDNKIYWIQFLFFIYIILEFLSVKFPINEIDIYHEGQRLSSAYKSKLDGSLWSGSYVTVGIIYETIGAKFIWKIFDNESIGLVRFLDIIYVFITKIILIFLSLEITKTLNFNSFFKSIFFIFLTLVFLNCNNYDLGSADLISFREIPILLSLLVFIISLKNLNNFNFTYILLGALTFLTFFWGVDRAIVQNLLMLFIIIYLIINRNYQNIGLIFVSSIFCWVSFYLYSKNEFNFFISNSISIIKEMTEVHGIIHPIPFSDDENSSRATKNLVLILISLLISLGILFSRKNNFTYRFKIILPVISFISFLNYINAIGRSDGPHLKQAFGFSVIFFSCYLLFYLIQFISKKYNLNNFNYNKLLSLLSLLIIFILINPSINFSKSVYFKSRLTKYINLNDNNFLSSNDKIFIKKTTQLIKNDKCVQLFTNDSALLYLLKKPSCTRFYFVWSIGSKKNQIKMIDELNNTKLIIKNGRTDNWGIPLKIRYPLLNNYINNNFTLEHSIEGRKIMYRK